MSTNKMDKRRIIFYLFSIIYKYLPFSTFLCAYNEHPIQILKKEAN